MRKLTALTLTLWATLGAAPALAQTLKIGAPQPMTGPDAPFGDKFKKAYAMAVEDVNAAGGVQGKKIEVVIEDHLAKNALAATVAEKLITQEKVLVMTGGRASGPERLLCGSSRLGWTRCVGAWPVRSRGTGKEPPSWSRCGWKEPGRLARRARRLRPWPIPRWSRRRSSGKISTGAG